MPEKQVIPCKLSCKLFCGQSPNTSFHLNIGFAFQLTFCWFSERPWPSANDNNNIFQGFSSNANKFVVEFLGMILNSGASYLPESRITYHWRLLEDEVLNNWRLNVQWDGKEWNALRKCELNWKRIVFGQWLIKTFKIVGSSLQGRQH
jgi:hypothetical protein